MLKPPCELGPLAIEIELFDFTESSSSIFITSKEYGLLRFLLAVLGCTPYGRAGLVGMHLYRRRRDAGTSTSSVTASLWYLPITKV